MLSHLVCGTPPRHITPYTCLSARAIRMIDADKQNQPGSEFDILATVNTTEGASSPVTRKAMSLSH